MNAMYEYVLAKRRAMEAQARAMETAMNVKPRYEYDSDEDTEGGTWEHKRRNLEMVATRGRSGDSVTFSVMCVCHTRHVMGTGLGVVNNKPDVLRSTCCNLSCIVFCTFISFIFISSVELFSTLVISFF